MVNFGKNLMADQFPEWKGYKLMKKKVKPYGQQLQQGEKDCLRVLKDSSKMLDESASTWGVGAVVGALSRNLAELQERQGSYLSIYDQPSSALKDPIIDMMNLSVDKLTHSTNFLRLLGQHALIVDEESPSTAGKEEIEDKKIPLHVPYVEPAEHIPLHGQHLHHCNNYR
ncbi:hypothetical protein ACP70R_040645 [Stipagrostis hirtigluma subsp. patula]